MKESKWLVKCLLNFVRHHRSSVDVLFGLLPMFHVRTRIDFTFLKHFLMVEVRGLNQEEITRG